MAFGRRAGGSEPQGIARGKAVTSRSRSSPRPSKAGTDSALLTIRDSLRRFAAERDWDQYHSPKNLAVALCVEAAELLEHFQWLTEDGSRSLSSEQLAQVREEMADVLLYLVRLADKLDVDLLEAARAKIELNARKYPVDKARGSSRKYTEL
jgi:NTP pyrophosphatase (non-canonical NTP hydrolase)